MCRDGFSISHIRERRNQGGQHLARSSRDYATAIAGDDIAHGKTAGLRAQENSQSSDILRLAHAAARVTFAHRIPIGVIDIAPAANPSG
mgnify:CR=1 FL=1